MPSPSRECLARGAELTKIKSITQECFAEAGQRDDEKTQDPEMKEVGFPEW
jgi:hypothetical protein